MFSSIEKNQKSANNYKVIVYILFILIFIFLLRSGIKLFAKDDYIFSKIEDEIYATLVDNGYSSAGACGILGNISVENPNFEPDLYANNGLTYGLFQWSEVGERKSTLIRWCNNRLLYPNRVEGQLAYAMYELQGGDSIAHRLNDYLKETSDPEMAAMEFAVGFERCIGSTGNSEADGIYLGTIYPEHYGESYQALTRRVNNAALYYEKYGQTDNEEVSETSALDIKIIPTAGIIAEQEDYIEDRIEDRIVIKIVEKENLWPYRIICLITGYLCGCILGAAIIVKAVRKKSVYKIGNHLPSMWNLIKHIGIKESVFAIIVDIGKLFLALGLAYLITGGALRREQILWVGLGVILGNDYPFWGKFRGGMGITVTLIFIYAYMPVWGFICCLLGLVIAIAAKSFPIGALFISVLTVPYAFFLRGSMAGIFFSIIMLILFIRHYRFLKRYIYKNFIKN